STRFPGCGEDLRPKLGDFRFFCTWREGHQGIWKIQKQPPQETLAKPRPMIPPIKMKDHGTKGAERDVVTAAPVSQDMTPTSHFRFLATIIFSKTTGPRPA